MELKYTDLISKNLNELKKLITSLTTDEITMISKISTLVINTIKSGGCIFWCGNEEVHLIVNI